MTEPQRPTEQIWEMNRAHLTREQESRLHADHTNTPGTNQIDNRRDYSGPRWAWLVGVTDE